MDKVQKPSNSECVSLWLEMSSSARCWNDEPHYDPGVDSASNRNEYQESSSG
jgi:hypothetical protein